jgi:transglutaminase-like putative cysteine protease
MDLVTQWLLRRFRPRIGWPLLALALSAALCPAAAAAGSPLKLPALALGWAGTIGLLLGLRVPATGERPLARVLRITLWVACGLLFLLFVMGALPPMGLLFQDLRGLWDWFVQGARRGFRAERAPSIRVASYLSESVPRVWRELIAAPSSGERGARLLVTVGSMIGVWLGALTLGWGMGHQRSSLGWGLPLLCALVLTNILGAGPAFPLISGLALLLLLAIGTDFRRHEAAWERAGVDYSGELLLDVLMWGVGGVTVLVTVAALLPAWIDNPLAESLWRDVETPSGIAVLERNIQRSQRTPPKVDPGISQLPALDLGFSLEDKPPEAIALRVRIGPAGNPARLPDAPWPQYWRARVYNIYNGRGWTQNARVSQLDAVDPQAAVFPGTVLQHFEDMHAERQLIFALPDPIAVSIPTNAERLPDGAESALTQRENDPSRTSSEYWVLSRPQELVTPPLDQPPPDMSAYLGLPRSLPPQVGETARAQTSGITNPYEQALALEQFLRELPYSYEVQPLPGGGDAVYQFLFDMRHGYCTYYASAMAVMARSLGIPARVATGFATGAYDQASGEYIVREADAHAWPELYIGNRWLAFEPTPIRTLPGRASTAEPPAPVPIPQEQSANIRGPLIWLAVLLGLGLLASAGWLLARRPAAAPLVVQVQERLERGGTRAGVPWPSGATLHEYGALLEPRLDGASGALHELIELVERVRYGRRELHEGDERRLRAAEAVVLEQLRQTRTPREAKARHP